MKDLIHYEVQLSEPFEHEQYGKPGELMRSMRNITMHIATDSLTRAVEMATKRHPEGTVHSVIGRGRQALVIDPRFVRPQEVPGDD